MSSFLDCSPQKPWFGGGDDCWPWSYPSYATWMMHRHMPALQITMVYLLVKGCTRWRCGGGNEAWDTVGLVHNVISVASGLLALYHFPGTEEQTCGSISDPMATVLLLQTAHCVSDFVIYLPEMLAEPVFIFHHAILFLVSCIQPHCPGCAYLVSAYSIAEFGSAAIATDAEWRKAGGKSRGFSRMVIFGGSRVLNLYLLYRLWLITPSVVNFGIYNENREVLTVNFPICMVTNLGGSLLMLMVNGVTWYRMLLSYLKHRKKRYALKEEQDKSK